MLNISIRRKISHVQLKELIKSS